MKAITGLKGAPPRLAKAPSKPDVAGTQSRLFIQSFATGLEVLLSFDAQHTSMNLPEIAETAGISKSAAQRFAFTLERLGFFRKDPITRRFSLTPKALDFGYRYLLANQLLERANPYLLELNRRSRETVNFSEPDGTDMVYTARFPNPVHSIVHMPVGRRLPMFCTASGRAYLSTLDDATVRHILESSERTKYTATTVTDIRALLGMIQQAREEGFSSASEEYYRGDLSIAVPVLNGASKAISSVNISALASRWTLDRMKRELAPMLMETSRMISTIPPSRNALEPFRSGYGLDERRNRRKGQPSSS